LVKELIEQFKTLHQNLYKAVKEQKPLKKGE